MKQLSKRKRELLNDTPSFKVKFPKYSFPDSKKELPKVLETMKNKPVDKKLINDLDKNNLKMMLDVVGESRKDYQEFIRDVDIYTMKLKMKYGRKRPYEISKIESVTDTDDSPSFPSGHAIEAHALEKVLSAKFPDKADELESMANKISLSRVQMGNHFPSDIIVGKKVGHLIADAYLKINKNIQISRQRGKTKDIRLPPKEKDDTECCELLAKIIEEATNYAEEHRFGIGMVGVPTFLDTSGYVPDNYFLSMIREWRDKSSGQENLYDDIIAQLDKTGDRVREYERLNRLWDEASQYGLYHTDTCQNIVNILDKWSDRNFVGWKFYEEWVNTYLTEEPEKAKERTQNDYDRYMDSYRKVWIALLQNDCADILIQKPWMNYSMNKSWEGVLKCQTKTK